MSLAESNGFVILPIKAVHLTALETLPMIHRDPFDRLLVATTLAERMTLVTRDENIKLYDVPQIWCLISLCLGSILVAVSFMQVFPYEQTPIIGVDQF